MCREGGIYIPQIEILKSVIFSFTILDVIFNLNHFMTPLPCTVLQGAK